MKIIAVTDEQFRQVWAKLTPMERNTTGLTARSLFLYSDAAMLVVAEDVTVGVLGDIPEPVSLRDLYGIIKELPTSPITEASHG